ncbi:HlyD family type I secretion periplasmic adaptor subunit [Legionella brunensis]|uniref:Membrane fusion protein (MFP) family protein n=1 Tax=Legionella brunensis TaxID=29422 RepID=A0A0W0SSU5_9GAMM|nr:HlyD family type I secretion periplasmic adaptor subunit [Legionella brunensis]KTC86424.1 secretion system protein D [Legionella brunensis]
MKWKNVFNKIFKRTTPSQEEEEFITDSKSALLNKSTPLAHGVLIITILLILSALIWAYFGEIEEITVGEGKVIPSSQIKNIQSLDGGIIEKIMIKEGDMVKKDQPLLELDDVRYKADFSQAFEKYLALSAMVARFNAEVNNQDTIIFPESLNKNPELKSREVNLFTARKKALQEQLNLLQHSHDLINQEIQMYIPLMQKGYASKIEYIRSVRAANEIKIQMENQKDKFREEALTNLNNHKAELSIVVEQLNSLRDKMVRTQLVSPVNGIVKKLNFVTMGGVVKPGDVIMEIVPLEDKLLIQAKIRPQDIGFVQLGQHATVKITAYDYSIYGGLSGKVEYISADAIKEEQLTPEARQDYYFLVHVRTDQNYLGNKQQKLYIMPGMTATVHIKTGEKTLLQYLLKPLIKAKQEALRER